MKTLNALIGCEESQVVAKELRLLGINAYSCDIMECSGNAPEFHIKGDITTILNGGEFTTQNGESHIVEKWELGIFFPPCTRLTCTANKWYKPEYRDRFPNIMEEREEAIKFFMSLYNAPIPNIAVENPIGVMSTRFRKPDQIIQPYQFGEPHQKSTCLWLKGLPKLKPTKIVEPELYTYKNGRKDGIWHVESMKLPPKERSIYRSKTFPGVAKAMAEQWGKDFLLHSLK